MHMFTYMFLVVLVLVLVLVIVIEISLLSRLQPEFRLKAGQQTLRL